MTFVFCQTGILTRVSIFSSQTSLITSLILLLISVNRVQQRYHITCFFQDGKQPSGEKSTINHLVLRLKDAHPAYHKGSQLETSQYMFQLADLHRFIKPPLSEKLKLPEAVQLYTHGRNTVSPCHTYNTFMFCQKRLI